jgi:putative membrane protein
MATIAQVLVGLVALIHIGISIVEIFFWKKPVIHERIGFKQDEANKAASIVANAGLYNGFLAAGLILSSLVVDGLTIQFFFLICVAIAGIFGAFTLRPTTLVLQTLPSLITLAVLYTTHVG